jgi:hypothetical protein
MNLRGYAQTIAAVLVGQTRCGDTAVGLFLHAICVYFEFVKVL